MSRRSHSPLPADRPRLARSYGRVSKIGDRGKNGKDLQSPAVQIEFGQEYFAKIGIPFDLQGSWDNGDWDESAFDRPWSERPGIVRHLKDARAGLLTDLSFYLISRFGRDLRESLDLAAAFEEAGCLLHFPNDGITPDSGDQRVQMAGRRLRDIRLLLAEWESQDKRIFAFDAAIKRARNGKVAGSIPGYLRKGENGIEPIPEIVAAVQLAADLRTQGISYRKIAAELNNKGYRSPTGRLWSAVIVQKYLTGSFIDTLRGNGFFNRDLPEGDPSRVVIPNAFPAIISEETARALHRVEKVSKSPHAGNRRVYSTRFLLIGKLRCVHCGKSLCSAQTAAGYDKRFYRCQYGVLSDGEREKHGGQTVMNFSAYQVEDAVARALRWYLLHGAQRWPSPPKPKSERKPKPNARTKEKIEGERKRLLALHLAETITEDDFKEAYKRLTDEIAAMEKAETAQEAPALYAASQTLMQSGEGITGQGLRRIITDLVEVVEIPIQRAGLDIGTRGNGKRRMKSEWKSGPPARDCVRIRLHTPITEAAPSVFIAPLYRANFAGHRQLWVEYPDGAEEEILPAEVP